MAKKKHKYGHAGLIIGALVCSFLWGSAFPGIKIGYNILDIGTADVGARLLFAGMRFFLAGIFAIIIGSIVRRRLLVPKLKNWGIIFRLSLLQTVIQYFFFYTGLSYTSGTIASIINSTSVFFSLIIATLIFKQERFSARKIGGVLIGFLGVLLVILFGTLSKSTNMAVYASLGGINQTIIIGDICILISSISSAFSSCKIKDFSKREDPFTLAGYQFALGGVILSATGYLAGGRISSSDLSRLCDKPFLMSGWLMLIYLALVSAVAYSIWGLLLKRYRVSSVTVFGFLRPIFGTVLSVLLLGEGQSISYVIIAVALIMVSYGTVLCVRENK